MGWTLSNLMRFGMSALLLMALLLMPPLAEARGGGGHSYSGRSKGYSSGRSHSKSGHHSDAGKDTDSLRNDQFVHGYRKKDGTYVKNYHRSQANGAKSDNYSTKGNVNPYTGMKGTKRVDR